MYHTTEYNREFWNAARVKRRIPNTTVLETGRDTQNGSYRLPYESNKKFEALRQKENLFRRIGTVVSAPKGDYTIWAHDNEPEVTWLTDKNPAFFENVETYDDYQLTGHTLGCATRISEDFAADAGFDVETQVTREFARSIGRAEEAACINGDGVNAPKGFLKDAMVGHYALGIDYSDVVDLFFAQDPEYRRNSVWIMNNETAYKLRTMTDGDGGYLWNHSDNTLLGKPVYISDYMPSETEGAGARPIAFGDFSYFWIVDRKPFAMRSLTEVLMPQQQVGYVGYETIDAKLIRPEAVCVMQMK